MLFKACLSAAFATVVAAKACQNVTIPVTISARNGVFGKLTIPTDPLGSTKFILDSTRTGHNATADALTGYATVSGSYSISAQICSPEHGSGETLQILTHGIGFDKTYWDLAYDNFNYSYVDTALKNGYSVLYYDRLGIGMSSHGDPLNEIQAFLEIEALAEITKKAKGGALPGCNTKFSKIIHFGHSFGSSQTYALSNMYPELSDGIVLTGFSVNASFLNLFSAGGGFENARYNQPMRFGNASTTADIKSVLNPNADPTIIQKYVLTDYYAMPIPPGSPPLDYPDGYFASRDVNNAVYEFLHPGNFDVGIAYYGEKGKQPVTMGELLTIGSLSGSPSVYPGPVLIFSGSDDLPFCGSNCYAPAAGGANIITAGKAFFPQASAFEGYIQPQTGHGLNLHYNATAGYQYINDWLKSQNLGA